MKYYKQGTKIDYVLTGNGPLRKSCPYGQICMVGSNCCECCKYNKLWTKKFIICDYEDKNQKEKS